MFVNNCYFERDGKMYVVCDMCMYEIDSNDDKVSYIIKDRYEEVEYSDCNDILRFYERKTIDPNNFRTDTRVTATTTKNRTYEDHYVSVNDYIYRSKDGSTRSISDNDYSEKTVHILSKELAQIYRIDPIQNYVVDFMNDVRGGIVDMTYINGGNSIELGEYVVANKRPSGRDRDKRYVYIPYVLQELYHNLYNRIDIYGMTVFFLLRCDIKKMILDRDIGYINSMEDVNRVKRLVVNIRHNDREIVPRDRLNIKTKISIVLHINNPHQIEYYIDKLNRIKWRYDLYITVPIGGCEHMEEIDKGEIYDMLKLLFDPLRVDTRYFFVRENCNVSGFLSVARLISRAYEHSYVLRLCTGDSRRYSDRVFSDLIPDRSMILIDRMKRCSVYGLNERDYDYKNHIRLCFLLNKIDVEIFPEQRSLFTKRMYHNMVQAGDMNMNSTSMRKRATHKTFEGPCFWIDIDLMNRYNLWEMEEYVKMDRGTEDTIYQQMSPAFRNMVSILAGLSRDEKIDK